jgi:hypothetical protein
MRVGLKLRRQEVSCITGERKEKVVQGAAFCDIFIVICIFSIGKSRNEQVSKKDEGEAYGEI